MNPLTNMKNQQKMNERELSLGLTGTSSSWHREYDDSAWVYIGGLPYELTEGDVICIFSQYGEIINVNLVRDKDTGKSKGFAFLCYEDQRSTILAVDNLNGAKVLGRALRVDHKHDYQVPKERADEDDTTKQLREQGCAPSTHTEPTASNEKETKKKKKKDKKKKRKKDRESRSRSTEVTKPSSPNQQVSECHVREASMSVHPVKSEFLDDMGNSGIADGKHSAGHKNDIRVKQETGRTELSSDNRSHKHHRSSSPRRHGKDVDLGHDSRRFPAVSESQSASHIEKSLNREPKGKDRSRTMESEEQRQYSRHDSKSSSRNCATEEVRRQFDRRDGREKRQRSSTSSDDDRYQKSKKEDSSGTAESERQSQDYRHGHGMKSSSVNRPREVTGELRGQHSQRDGREKRCRRSSSSSDDDHSQTRSDERARVAEHERHQRQNTVRSKDGSGGVRHVDEDLHRRQHSAR